jgi:L-amino acid N-acyltransferase YncA
MNYSRLGDSVGQYVLQDLGENHRQPVIDVFNYFIRHTYAAFPGREMGYDLFDRFLEMSHGYPRVAIKGVSGEVVGFAFLRPYHFADSFRRTAEITYFIMPEHTRQGLGTAILQRFCRQSREMGLDSILAPVSSLNPVSLDFHHKNGFRECGRFLKVGRKWGEDFDVVWLQKHL